MARTSPQSSTLRLYTEPGARGAKSTGATVASLPEVLQAFQQAMGWSLRYASGPAPKASSVKSMAEQSWSAPVNAGPGASPGHLTLGPLEGPGKSPPVLDSLETDETRLLGPSEGEAKSPVCFEAARGLASAIGGMLEETLQLRRALIEREAELAAGVPLVPHPEEPEHLANRLEAVLRGGAQAVGCHAAAMYLLDEATSKLKLRSCWGLPLDRLTAPPRPLKGAVADLESLLGHAVVLEDTPMMHHWRAPEEFAAAVCVPISTSTTILGTLWMFSNGKREFNDSQTNIIEVVAGRLAADLEREMLWQEGFAAAAIKKQIAAAERLQRNQLPTVAPLLDHWDLAGWTAQAEALGGDFHDWFCLPDGLLAVAVGHAMDGGIQGALAASGLKAALRAHGQYYREAQQTLKRLNLTLWTGSAGDQHATLFYGLIETATGRVTAASAGHPGALVIRSDGWESLTQISARLGEGPESIYEQTGYELQPGETLALFTDGALETPGLDGKPLGEMGMGKLLQAAHDRPAAEMAAILRRQFDKCAYPGIAMPTTGRDRTVLVVKRRK
ncbi:MAG: GAF domain-containing SpoIIE family protein phosphatase [Thermoguttaceae bacterium]